MINIDELKQILDIVREHGITEFELEREDVKLRVKKNGFEPSPDAIAAIRAAAAPPVAAPPVVAPALAGVPSAPAAVQEGVELAIVKSPIVGTFYRSPEPGARAFVEIGTMVRKGQVLCIIEAMKLMNEINAEYDGEVAAIYVENGQAVQYGERLFALKRA
jgi:acetyl-CoA carboxylase biotin carboxyl carrier protein